MAIGKLVYTPTDVPTSQEHPHTMVLMVNDDVFQRYKKGDKSIPLAEVVTSFDVLKYENPGKAGRLVRPSKREIEDAFGTTRDDDVVQFMLDNGSLNGKMK